MGLYDAAKSALELAKQVRDAKIQAELVQKIIELQQITLDQNEELRVLRSKVESLQHQIESKAHREEVRKQLYVAASAYWRDGDDPNAYCIRCFEAQGDLVVLIQHHLNRAHSICPVCKTMYPYWYAKKPPRKAQPSEAQQ